MTTGEKGLTLIKKWEGCTLKAYKLTGEKYYTIGYGHSFDTSITAGTVWTKQQAEAALKKDLQKFEGYVTADVPLPLNQHQFDALVSYCYNRGRGGLRQLVAACKTLADYPAKMVELWGSATRYKTGLINRRKAEAALFVEPVLLTYPVPARTLRKGCKGDDVKWVQQRLNAEGAGLSVDGDFGALKRAAVIEYQLRHGLAVDGIVGPVTRKALGATT